MKNFLPKKIPLKHIVLSVIVSVALCTVAFSTLTISIANAQQTSSDPESVDTSASAPVVAVPTGGLVQCDEQAPGSCSLCALFSTVKAVYDKITELVLILAVIYVLFGGYQILTAGANPSLYAKGRKHILNAFFGVILVLGAWFLVNAFITALTGTGSIYGAPWQTLKCQ